LSTKSSPSAVENATTLVPTPLTTTSLSDKRVTPLAACPRSSDGKPNATVPASALFNNSLRSKSCLHIVLTLCCGRGVRTARLSLRMGTVHLYGKARGEDTAP